MGILDKLLKGGSDTVKAAILSESEFFNDLDNVPTDISAINIALGGTLDGGITGGVTMVSGASKSFKTCVSLFCVAAFLKKHKDSACIFYDTEFGASKQYFESFGIDVNRVLHIPIENIEQLKFDMVNRLGDIKRKDKVIVFIDSIGNIASKKEVEDAKDEKAVADMSRAKALKSLWRIVTPMLVMRDIPCIAINHVYQTQEMYAKTVVSGGCLLAGTQIKMSDGSLKKIEEVQVGDKVVTMIGDKIVTHAWNPETLIEGTPECYTIQFEDGYEVTCSENHMFYIDEQWIKAKDLVVGMDVKQL